MNFKKNNIKKNILVIGAFERDNFGDLLFYILTEKILNKYNCNVVPASIIVSEMNDIIGKTIFPYNILLESYRWDAVIVAGGEIGRCNFFTALEMSLNEFQYGEYLKIHEYINQNNTSVPLAYLPDVKSYPKNKSTRFIVNSVGGFNELDYEYIKYLTKVLSRADAVGVRDHMSFDYLKSIGIESELFPDIVHALPLYYPKKLRSGKFYIVFQINKKLALDYSIETIAQSLIEISKKFKSDIYFMCAGTANRHDDFKIYEQIKFVMDKYIEKDSTKVVYERNPLKLVDLINGAGLFVGSSLHGRIVSAAYSVPRISLTVKKKLTEYIKLWDPLFPYDRRLDTLVDDCEKAFSIRKKDLNQYDKIVKKKNKSNIRSIIEKIFAKN